MSAEQVDTVSRPRSDDTSSLAGKPLTVLHVVESWRPVVSGYTTRSWEIVAAQARTERLQPSVLVSSRQRTYGHGDIEIPSALTGRIILMPCSSRELWWRRLRAFHVDQQHLETGIARACDSQRPALIHVHWSSGLGMAAARVAADRGLPLVAEVRFDLAGAMMTETIRLPAPALEGTLRRRFERHLPRAQAVIAASDSLGRLVRDTFPALASRVSVVPNGIDSAQFQPGEADAALRRAWGADDKLIVGSTSNMLAYEGLDLLVQALARLRDRLPVHAVFVGGGPQLAKLQALATQLKVPATFTGRVPGAQVPRYLRSFDLFAVPRRSAAVTRYASPIKLVEAMGCGVASVGSAVGDIPDLFADGRGVAVAPGAVSELAEAILALGRNEPERLAIGHRAADWAHQQLSWSLSARQYEQVYAGLIA